MESKKRKIDCVIFDLDGVLVCTDELHFQSWQKVAEEENIFFSREINQRQRGISRRESLDVLLEKAEKKYTEAEKCNMMDRKNRYFQELISSLTPQDTLPGVIPLLHELKARNIKIGVGSSSKNAKRIMDQIKLNSFIDTIIDGNDITHSKPHPEVFLRAAECLHVAPEACVVIEDAQAGVEAALNAGMAVYGIDYHNILDIPDKSASCEGIDINALLAMPASYQTSI